MSVAQVLHALRSSSLFSVFLPCSSSPFFPFSTILSFKAASPTLLCLGPSSGMAEAVAALLRRKASKGGWDVLARARAVLIQRSQLRRLEKEFFRGNAGRAVSRGASGEASGEAGESKDRSKVAKSAGLAGAGKLR